jgi:hypothetical protein
MNRRKEDLFEQCVFEVKLQLAEVVLETFRDEKGWVISPEELRVEALDMANEEHFPEGDKFREAFDYFLESFAELEPTLRSQFERHWRENEGDADPLQFSREVDLFPELSNTMERF